MQQAKVILLDPSHRVRHRGRAISPPPTTNLLAATGLQCDTDIEADKTVTKNATIEQTFAKTLAKL